MSKNQEMIKKYFPIYKELYFNKFNIYPTSWFTFQRWLADSNIAHTFQLCETALCAELFNDVETLKALQEGGYQFHSL